MRKNNHDIMRDQQFISHVTPALKPAKWMWMSAGDKSHYMTRVPELSNCSLPFGWFFKARPLKRCSLSLQYLIFSD